MKIHIIIATHKKYKYPIDKSYIPIGIGKCNTLPDKILKDNNGDNISDKNPSFCELTALYWAWKNHFFDNIDFIGLVHYRRYFKGKGLKFQNFNILSYQELEMLLNTYQCIIPKKRNYYIETVYNHYKNAHYIKDLDMTRMIIADKYPDYLDAFDKIMSSKKISLFNMFIMNKKHTIEYCEWLFDILFTLEEKIETSYYSAYQKRVFGFIAERLLNVWLLKKSFLVKEIRVINLEPENIVKKVTNFIIRKYLKYKS